MWGGEETSKLMVISQYDECAGKNMNACCGSTAEEPLH